jgi:Uma2 family endonuclease
MVTSLRPMTLAEYLEYDDGTDTIYELIDGIPVPMPPESDPNRRIASLLMAQFLSLGIPYYNLGIGIQVAVSGRRARSRQPDLVLLSNDAASALQSSAQSVITYDMPPPRLVVEVVSPRQEDRDYRYKRTEYAGRQIPEYWIVDPAIGKITVLQWVDGLYEEQVFVGKDAINSPELGLLQITVAEILGA